MKHDNVLGRDFLGTGWAFPVAISRAQGLIESVSYEEDIQQSIRIILGTSKGERVMRPGFGCGIHDLAFAAISTQVMAEIGSTVREALRDFEARIDVIDVRVGTRNLEQGHLDVDIDYTVRATNQPGNLVYPFYFRESANP
jgi:phage baseplate assembly protein W